MSYFSRAHERKRVGNDPIDMNFPREFETWKSETGQLGQIGHNLATLKKVPFLYDYFIREDVFVPHNKKISIRADVFTKAKKY